MTITGKFGVAVERGMGRNANVAVTDGDLNFAAVEDLGSGLKAGATIALRTRGRENTQSLAGDVTTAKTTAYSEVGRDATVWMSGGFGKVTAGSIELGNGITGLGWGGTNVSLASDLNNGGVLSANAYANILAYESPVFNGFKASVTRADSIGTVGIANASVVSVGGVNVDNDRGVSANVLGLSYENGPFAAAIDSANFGNRSNTNAAYDRKRNRMSAAYDFGMVKVGFGQEDNKGTASTGTYDGKQTTFGASVPVTTALRAGLVSVKNNETAVVGTAGVTAKGTGFGADYSFSKRTVLNVSYAKISRDGSTDALKEGKSARVRLMHSF